MIKGRRDNRGFTVLEVIITTLIASIIIGCLTGFLVVSTKSYNTNKDIVDLQYQAQVTLNTMVDKVMYSEGVRVFDEGIRLTNKQGTEHSYFLIKEEKLYYIEDSSSDKCSLEDIWDKYCLESNDSLQYLLASNIKNIEVLQGSSEAELESIRIELTLAKEKINLVVSSQVVARNYKREGI